MAKFAEDKIECFVGPDDLGGPDNLEAAVVDFIQGAEKTLDIAVQELESEVIAEAILNAAMSGVSVRMFLEQDYLQASRAPSISPEPNETDLEARARTYWKERRRPKTRKTNRDIFAALLRCGVDVKADLNPKIFHQKFIVRDYRNNRSQGKPALMTGSTNFTPTGVHKNLNHLIVFHDYRICRCYQSEFDEIRDGTFGKVRNRHEGEPKTINIKGVPVRILFAPDHSPELEIVKQMLKCSSRLDFAIFTFSGSSSIDDAMVMLRAANRRVRGAVDPGQGMQWWAATKWLHREGIEVFLPNRDQLPGFGKLHHKLMVIDDVITVAGSMNYTAPANCYNDENIFVLGSPHNLPKSKGGPVDHAVCREIARYFRNEIDRIISNSDRYDPQ